MTNNIHTHYQNLFEIHGNSAKAVQWADEKSQARRFQILSEISPNIGSVLDLGCGLGHLHDFLRNKGHINPYLGLDFVEEFIQYNQANKIHPNTKFEKFDMATDVFPDNFDTHIICGIFNNKTNNNLEFMHSVIEKAFAAANKFVAFNAMSTYVDFQADDLFYSNPCDILDFCKKNITQKITLRHDYLVRDDRPPFEYTVYLYK